MKIELRFYGELRQHAGVDVLPFVTDDPVSLADVLAWLRDAYPLLAEVVLNDAEMLRPEINLLVNGSPDRPNNSSVRKMRDGDRLFFLRAYGGG